MATFLTSRTRNVLSSFFSERWFSVLAYQDHLAHKTSPLIVDDLVKTKDGSRASFSTCAVSTHKSEVLDVPSSIPDEKYKPLQDQFSPKNCQDLFRAWGCTADETSQIFERMPSLHKAKLDKLQPKLKILFDLGFTSSDLVKIISRRPRVLRSRISHSLDERVRYLENLFGSKVTLQKAILRNASILTYDLKTMIKPTVQLYKSMGITGDDLTLMLLSRPTIIPRTSLSAEKLEYIRKTGISKDSKMYKYVVTLMAISRVETIREKIANLEKFGFTEDEVLCLVGKSPLILTLSVDKVQRNMTFVVATMKLPAKVVLDRPFLVYNNLELVMKPRVIVAGKIVDMGLVPRIEGLRMFTALRMTEKRFMKAFIDCHPPEIAKELKECYIDAKHVKRLAEESKKIFNKGFPF
ncbi:mitochodrial transcription termination factor [Artemisia annua]|uniref:Mitochodrial transcription termination factor n=1 Tax=Artemisia annua TaxID=35608 RepID=A0A2U1KDJ4_ARTAN|nr:mitochodrial transcription termination factor [Artemisia annua]